MGSLNLLNGLQKGQLKHYPFLKTIEMILCITMTQGNIHFVCSVSEDNVIVIIYNSYYYVNGQRSLNCIIVRFYVLLTMLDIYIL